jgi:two-component system KDP operon response regulator KdpE
VSRILVVDDDPGLVKALAINLRARKYDVDAAGTGADALRLAASSRPDAVILDLGLPDMDGTDVVRGLRGWTTTPIVVLSARADQTDKVAALDAGADDYVTKPFGMDELLARLRAALRRSVTTTDVAASVVDTTSFRVDLANKRVSRDGQDVRLTPTEWHLLELLARSPGRLVTQRQLLSEIWGPGTEKETQYLRVYIGTLRRKLEPVPSVPRHLITDPGIGYRLEL